jgi:uncharacterized protein (DUF169 family)
MITDIEVNKSTAGTVFTAALGLDSNVVGVRLLTKDEYERLDIQTRKGPVCFLIRRGREGIHFKADPANIACSYGRFALGVEAPHRRILDAEGYAVCGLYEDGRVAKEILAGFKYISPDYYGVEFGPIEDVEDPDLAIIICNTKQAMRIFQGYAYYYATPCNLASIGDQAGCSDLISRPFSTDDINLSLFCNGARAYGQFTDGEIGISIPKSKYIKVADGVLKTVDPVCNIREKKAIEERFRTAGYRCEFDLTASYGIALTALDEEIEAEQKQQNTGI